LLLIHVIGMRIEPREHSFQRVPDELIIADRLDITLLDLFEHILKETEIAAISGRSGAAGSGTVATV